VSAGPDAQGSHGIFGGRGEVVATGVSIAQLVSFLSQRLDRPVVDKTGLSRSYDFTLMFAEEESQSDLALFAAPPPGT
jgi:uncharacterized protein (TIGR03435 family)